MENGDLKDGRLPHPGRLHTTALGEARIKRNLSLTTEDVVRWCREKAEDDHVFICTRGKNWYVYAGDCVITIHRFSHTIITAHKHKG